MSAQPFPLDPSLWHATAVPAPDCPPLDKDVDVDVAIVGGGYAGLSTALHLAERGVSCVVLEAREPGWGGSGRNGGQVIPGLKYDPNELVTKFGEEAGKALAAFAGSTADVVFDLIAKHGMNVPHVRNGWIQGAHMASMVETAKKRSAEWARLGAPTEYLDKARTTDHLGTDVYLAGWLDRRGGAVQPLSYARELCRAAQKAGAVVHGQSPVESLAREGTKWKVRTAQGATVTAAKVALCTNGYTGGYYPKLAQTIIPPNSYQVATEPLSDNLRKSILPYGQVTSDTRQLLLYFRLDHEGRLLMGGRGPFREPTDKSDWSHLERVIARMYPAVKDAPIQFRWCGRVAVTRDFLPHLHEPEPGLVVNIGCQGRGVGLESAMGRALAGYLATGDAKALPFPVTPVKTIPFHGLNRAYVAAVVAYYRMSDAGLA
ncbi:FAD-binding oxidoreductase [Alsobacter sp. KACC 23698]|uniref:FAD-binding oxidoreductase n=1 Tax=Alsobacter sp. KACC 23698 TaxID=3149229 RepID=A0AAU7JDL8_9HYPH